MIKFRRSLKRWLYGSCPGFAGRFPYYGTKIFFPHGSLIFGLACEQGVYEHENIKLLLALCKPDTYYFDVGANIGLMSVPILLTLPSVRVVSFEPSPSTFPYLEQTCVNSDFRSRWQILAKAVGRASGESDFFVADAKFGAFEGAVDTGRGGAKHLIKVPITTLDAEWVTLGRPAISAIKIDIEGSDLDVLAGGQECIAATMPYILIEWQSQNFRAYGRKPQMLLEYASEIGYCVYASPGLVPIGSEADLRLHMAVTETFILAPKKVLEGGAEVQCGW